MKKLLFTGQMMLAYNQDRKRQTRRVATGIQPGVPRKPAYEPGSIVVLASTWAVLPKYDHLKPTEIDPDEISIWFWYDGKLTHDIAGHPVPYTKPSGAGKNRPGRFLPKSLYSYLPKARIVAAKLEPVQAISEADAIAKGVEPLFAYDEIHHQPHYRAELDLKPMPYKNYLWKSDAWPHHYSSYSTAVGSFSSLWQKINGPRGYGWDDNPFVWAYTLEPVSEVGDG